MTIFHIDTRENTPIARGRALPREDGGAILLAMHRHASVFFLFLKLPAEF